MDNESFTSQFNFSLKYNNISNYIQIIKPKIILGNVLSLISGFALGSKQNINYLMCFKLILSMSLIIASSCVLNNLVDQDIDKIMLRTKNRAIAIGAIKKKIVLFIL